jgi:hypothetical protein
MADYISVNQINTYIDCGYRYKLQYVDNHKSSNFSLTMLYGQLFEELLTRHIKGEVANKSLRAHFADIVMTRLSQVGDLSAGFLQALMEFLEAVYNHGPAGNEDEAYALDTLAVELNGHGYSYKPRVKNLKGSKSDSLLSNGLLEVLYNVERTLINPQYVAMLQDIEEVFDQYHFNVPVASWEKPLMGYIDILIKCKSGGWKCFDIKYSTFDYADYNINTDTQLHVYLKALQRTVEGPVTIGFMTPRSGDLFHICDNELLLSKETSERIKLAHKGMESQFFMPACGGGAYQSVTKLCGVKCHCPYASGKVE